MVLTFVIDTCSSVLLLYYLCFRWGVNETAIPIYTIKLRISQAPLSCTPSSVIGGDLALRAAVKLVENRKFEQLVDFDNHLDNIQLDWTNPAINRAIDTHSLDI